jgi:lipopolysaccharide transport system ATP-binding protein
MIQVENLFKTFKIYRSPADRLKELVFRRQYCREFQALKGVSMRVEAGETLGVIGLNGAGKSTLLKILTGILMPDSGFVQTEGRAIGLLELGTGFNPEFSGLHNIYFNGTLLGMAGEEIQQKLDQIIGFSELGDFIEQPLKTYSTGMIMRLAFATAIHADPDTFVVDEALSVGDAYFQQKCIKRIKQFKENGGAIVFVSHDMNAIKLICDEAMLLDHGSVVEAGSPDSVVNRYNFLLARKSQGETIGEPQPICDSGKTYGNLKVEISDVELINGKGVVSETLICGEPCQIRISLKANDDVDELTVGILIRDRFGQDIFGTNTYHHNLPIMLRNEEATCVTYDIEEMNLGPGKYTLTVAAHQEEAHTYECYQWIDRIRSFEVIVGGDFRFIGLCKMKLRVSRVA